MAYDQGFTHPLCALNHVEKDAREIAAGGPDAHPRQAGVVYVIGAHHRQFCYEITYLSERCDGVGGSSILGRETRRRLRSAWDLTRSADFTGSDQERHVAFDGYIRGTVGIRVVASRAVPRDANTVTSR